MNSDSGEQSVLLGFVGDLLVDRDVPDEAFSQVRQLLSEADVLFANLESPYSDAPQPAPTVQLVPLCPPAHNLDCFARAGFHVMSLANNHILDAGHEAMLETRRRIQRQGVMTCGAGEDLAAARRPALTVSHGLKIGFLAYASVFPQGYQASSTVPGLVPLRAHNHFHDQIGYFAPEYAPRVESIPDPKDHEHLIRDIDALRATADLVVMSFHWGDHLRPFVVTEHEKRTARLCIERGANLVLGHHHHSLRGIEWYQGKPVFYGLGHFVFDHRLVVTEEMQAYFDQADPKSYSVLPREGWPLLPLHPDTRMTLLGWARTNARRIVEAGFVPCRLRPDGRVTPVHPESAEGREVVEYVAKCNQSQGLNGRLLIDDAPRVGGHPSVRVIPIN